MTANPKQIQLFLIPSPGQKPEFLATIEGLPKTPLDSSMPEKIVLENYTRDPWAWKPNPSVWQSFHVKSVDGRNKLPGFLKYLKDRQKSAFGRFADKESILVISYIQKTHNTTNKDDGPEIMMECRMAWDISTVPGCPLKPPPPKPVHEVVAAIPAIKAPAPANPLNNKPKRKGGGLLGNLVASQKRTNVHVQVASSKPKREESDNTATGGGGDNGSGNKKTAQQVMAEFRQSMEEKMLDFDISPDPVMRVQVNVAEQQRDLATLEDKAKITNEILKYIVYEQCEEVNEEWIAYKEPSEFMDEVTIAIYKEGEAPPEVLEEINKGELPDEVRGQQQAMQAERQKQMDMKERSKEMQIQRKALQERAAEDDDEALNVKKRDRRTIEEIQREQEGLAKRPRMP